MTFNVKDKSLYSFFEITENDMLKKNISPYNLLKDEIIISKRFDLQEGDEILFEIEDWGEYSRKKLINTYKYTVDTYDSVSIRLVLIDFKISLQNL